MAEVQILLVALGADQAAQGAEALPVFQPAQLLDRADRDVAVGADAEPAADCPSTRNSSDSSRSRDVQSISLPGSPPPDRMLLRSLSAFFALAAFLVRTGAASRAGASAAAARGVGVAFGSMYALQSTRPPAAASEVSGRGGSPG